MRITSIVLAASVFAASTGTVLAQTSYDPRTGEITTSELDVSRIDPRTDARIRSNDNPAGVIDGTNPNPDPTKAGGILSPDALVNR